jgi:hypothetical protein
MAPRKKKVEVEEVEEVDELDELDDLEDLADDEEDVEDEDDEEGEDEEEAPAKKSKKSTKKPAKKKESTTYGSSELAADLDTSGRELRVMLRQKKIEKNANNRYEWDDLDSALEDLGFDDVDEAKGALSESRTKRLEELKERVGSKKKKSSKGKKAKADEPEEVDEYDADEDEEPAPAKKKKRATK